MFQKSKGSDYKCSQLFGFKGVGEKIRDQDIISTLKFNQDGSLIALGDKAGRIIIFKENPDKDGHYVYFHEFQGHTRQFDAHSSIEIEEEIKNIFWMKPQGKYHKMITCNSKDIKIWKIHEKSDKILIKTMKKDLQIPKVAKTEENIASTLQMKIPSKHEENLISAACTKNQQYLISSDSLKTFLWDFEKPSVPYVIADMKKDQKAQDVKENINCLKEHPTSDNLFAYGTNRGSLFLSDMRISNSSQPLKLKIEQKKSVLNEMLSSCSSLTFLQNSKFIVCRDYLTIKIWDITQTKKPISCMTVQQSLKKKLCQICEKNYIFDEFNICASRDSNTILTGDYNNNLHLMDFNEDKNYQYELNYKKQTIVKEMKPKKFEVVEKMNYQRKTQVCDFNPKKNVFGVASLNCFFLYSI